MLPHQLLHRHHLALRDAGDVCGDVGASGLRLCRQECDVTRHGTVVYHIKYLQRKCSNQT